jgi:exo-beta-1,3-glucanase (GH17 family)
MLHMDKKREIFLICIIVVQLVFVGAVSANTSDSFIKGVAYNPHMPGEGCDEFGKANYTQDFMWMNQANINTIRTYDQVPEEILDTATKHGIDVIEGIWIAQTGDFSDDSFKDNCKTHIKAVIDRDKNKPCIIGWCIGNELNEGNVRSVGNEATEKFLSELYDYAKSLDPNHFVTHANWPPLDDLDLSFFDVISFNIYTYWPPKVGDRGYYDYIRELREKYPEKPLLVTEFGYSTSPDGPGDGGYGGNSEEEQAELIKECWNAIVDAGYIGGMVFEWNDEWWKNECYGEDKNTHKSDDPEEWFGIIAVEGAKDDYTIRKKMAYDTVQEMFGKKIEDSEEGCTAIKTVDDFEDVSDWNPFDGSDDGGIGRVTLSQDPGWSGQALKAEYETTTSRSWWFVKKIINQNCSVWDRLSFYYKAAPESDDIFVGLVDADGETWCAKLNLDNTDWKEVTINLTEFQWLDPWGKVINGIFNLSTIKEIRFRHWPGNEYRGTFWVDELKIETCNIILIEDFEDVDFTDVNDWNTFSGCTHPYGCGYVSRSLCLPSLDAGRSGQALKINYNTTGPGGYWYVYKVLNQNWSDVARLSFYYNETLESKDIFVALKDADNETWCAELDNDNTDWEKVTINVSNFSWIDPWGDDQGRGNGVLDLYHVKQIRFRHWPQRVWTGTFWVDEMKIER